MRVGCARHGDSTQIILQAIGRLVGDILECALLIHVIGEAAALNHEVRDNAMKNGAIIVTLIGIALEIRTGSWRCNAIKFQGYDAFVGGKSGFHCLRIPKRAKCTSLVRGQEPVRE